MLTDEVKTKEQLVSELVGLGLRQQLAELETPGTKRKRGEEALRESEEKYRALVEDSPNLISIHQDGVSKYTNKVLCKALGWTVDEFLSPSFNPVERVVAERYQDLVRENIRRRLRGEHIPPYEICLRTRDAGEIPVLVFAQRIMYGGKPAIQVTFVDISQRKQMEEALRDSEEKLRKMFESVTDGILVIDLNGVITEVNQRIVEIHGFSSKDELLGKSAFELVTPRDHEKIATSMRQAIKRGPIRGVEYTLLKADGSEFPGELSTSVLKDASGNVIGHITI